MVFESLKWIRVKDWRAEMTYTFLRVQMNVQGKKILEGFDERCPFKSSNERLLRRQLDRAGQRGRRARRPPCPPPPFFLCKQFLRAPIFLLHVYSVLGLKGHCFTNSPWALKLFPTFRSGLAIRSIVLLTWVSTTCIYWSIEWNYMEDIHSDMQQRWEKASIPSFNIHHRCGKTSTITFAKCGKTSIEWNEPNRARAGRGVYWSGLEIVRVVRCVGLKIFEEERENKDNPEKSQKFSKHTG